MNWCVLCSFVLNNWLQLSGLDRVRHLEEQERGTYENASLRVEKQEWGLRGAHHRFMLPSATLGKGRNLFWLSFLLCGMERGKRNLCQGFSSCTWQSPGGQWRSGVGRDSGQSLLELRTAPSRSTCLIYWAVSIHFSLSRKQTNNNKKMRVKIDISIMVTKDRIWDSPNQLLIRAGSITVIKSP